MEKIQLFFSPARKKIIEELTGKKFNEDGVLETQESIVHLTKPLSTKMEKNYGK